MKEIISEKLKNLAFGCSFPLYVVGGAVREYLSGFPVAGDIDICAPVSAEKFSSAALSAGFKIDAVYKNTGTVKISCGRESYEFASFRSDRYIRGEHRPARTFFTDDITLDARRRDFKCNAVYYDIAEDCVVDPLGGVNDIKNKIISAVAEADKVFGEDGLRLMRLARIAAQTGFLPDDNCLSAAKNNAELIRDVAPERVYTEFNLILHADHKYGIKGAHANGLQILKNTGVLGIVLPELVEGDDIEQRKDYHKYDVLQHSLKAAEYSAPEIRLAALLHDVGKPYCFKKNGNFVGHETEGARIAENICLRLKVPKKLAAETVKLIGLHMYDLRLDARENKVRKFILRNFDVFEKLLLLKQADYSACTDDLSEAPAVTKFTAIYNKMRGEGVPFSLKELKVKGGDMLEIGLPPEYVGITLAKLLYDCAIGTVANDREKLIDYAKKVYCR